VVRHDADQGVKTTSRHRSASERSATWASVRSVPDPGDAPILALAVQVGEGKARRLLVEAACSGVTDAGRDTGDQDDLGRKT